MLHSTLKQWHKTYETKWQLIYMIYLFYFLNLNYVQSKACLNIHKHLKGIMLPCSKISGQLVSACKHYYFKAILLTTTSIL